VTVAETTQNSASLAERYRVLLEIGRALTATLNDEDLYASVYRETARVMEADGFYISLYDRDNDEATVVFWADEGPRAAGPDHLSGLGEPGHPVGSREHGLGPSPGPVPPRHRRE
jgi:hypothetical protein